MIEARWVSGTPVHGKTAGETEGLQQCPQPDWLRLPAELFIMITAELDVEDTACLLESSPKMARHFSPLVKRHLTQNQETALTGAVVRRFHMLAECLLACGVNPNTPDALHQMTCLHHAALLGDARMVKLLLKHGGDLSIKGTAGCTPLHLCASEDCTRIMVEAGAPLEAGNDDGATPLFWAAARGRFKIVEYLCKHKANPDAKDNDRWTPLHCAAAKGYHRVLKTLLDCNADGNAVDRSGLTPLHYASFRGHLECVKELINRGVNVNPVEGTSLTPLSGAANAGHHKVVIGLLNGGASEGLMDALFSAAASGQATVVEVLVQHNREAVKPRLNHAFRIAVERGHVGIVEFLLKEDLDMDLTRPVLYAANNDHWLVLETLFKSRYDLRKQAKAYLNLEQPTPELRVILQGYVGSQTTS